MDRRKFIHVTHHFLLWLFIVGSDREFSIFSKGCWQKKDNCWSACLGLCQYTMPGYDVSPVLSQIFSDVAYAGFDGVETMEHPLRSAVYTKQIKELIDQYKIKLIGSSYGGDMWNKDKQNQIYEDVDLIFTNMASVRSKNIRQYQLENLQAEKRQRMNLIIRQHCLKRIISLERKRGIVLNLHNHTAEVENKMYDLRGTLKRIPDIKLGPDLNWLAESRY
jgi:sugar phosphate isomerase/epimerase